VLAGVNTAIDMDNILRSIEGNMAMTVHSVSGGAWKMSMCAELGHSSWLADVDYWKKSCPSGSKIVDWRTNGYCYTDGKTSFYFGVSDDKQFYGGSDAIVAMGYSHEAAKTLPAWIKDSIMGKKLAWVVGLNAILQDTSTSNAVSTLLKPLLGEVHTLLYSVK